jgi:uncharacterized protein (DUF433 family)
MLAFLQLPEYSEDMNPSLKSPAELLARITINPEQCGGRPCIRGMRIRVVDVLELLAAGLTREEVLKELPNLEADDITAALLFHNTTFIADRP